VLAASQEPTTRTQREIDEQHWLGSQWLLVDQLLTTNTHKHT